MPRLTGVLALVCVLVWGSPGAMAWLAYDREAVFSGQLWRLITGHLCHESGAHLFWNLAAFCALGAWLERADARAYRLLLPLSALGIGATLMVLPQVEIYMGLSGVNTALSAFLLTHMARAGRGWEKSAALGLFALLLSKLAYEWVSGATLFVTPDAGWTPLPAAHLAGAAIGLLLAVVAWKKFSNGPAREKQTVDGRPIESRTL